MDLEPKRLKRIRKPNPPSFLSKASPSLLPGLEPSLPSTRRAGTALSGARSSARRSRSSRPHTTSHVGRDAASNGWPRERVNAPTSMRVRRTIHCTPPAQTLRPRSVGNAFPASPSTARPHTTAGRLRVKQSVLPALPLVRSFGATCGWMLRRGRHAENTVVSSLNVRPSLQWERFYYVADPASQLLTQFARPGSDRASDVQILMRASVRSLGWREVNGEFVFCFDVCGPGRRPIVFGVETKEEALQWMAALRRITQRNPDKEAVRCGATAQVEDFLISAGEESGGSFDSARSDSTRLSLGGIGRIVLFDGTPLSGLLDGTGMKLEECPLVENFAGWRVVSLRALAAVKIQSTYAGWRARLAVFGAGGKKEQAVAACQMQSIFRGKRARSENAALRERIGACRKIQRAWRCHVARASVLGRVLEPVIRNVRGNSHIKEHLQARRIEKTWRMHKVKPLVATLRAIRANKAVAIAAVQSAVEEGHFCYVVHRSAVVLQSLLRGARVRIALRLRREQQAATLVQRCYRAKVARAVVHLVRRVRAANKLQRWERSLQRLRLGRAWRRLQYTRRKSATRIQAEVRRKLAIIRVYRKPRGVVHCWRAATAIERHCRGYLCRLHWARIKAALPVLQNFGRIVVSRDVVATARRLARRRFRSAAKIQAALGRGCLARKRVMGIPGGMRHRWRCAIILQSKIRRCLLRWRYCAWVGAVPVLQRWVRVLRANAQVQAIRDFRNLEAAQKIQRAFRKWLAWQRIMKWRIRAAEAYATGAKDGCVLRCAVKLRVGRLVRVFAKVRCLRKSAFEVTITETWSASSLRALVPGPAVLRLLLTHRDFCSAPLEIKSLAPRLARWVGERARPNWNEKTGGHTEWWEPGVGRNGGGCCDPSAAQLHGLRVLLRSTAHTRLQQSIFIEFERRRSECSAVLSRPFGLSPVTSHDQNVFDTRNGDGLPFSHDGTAPGLFPGAPAAANCAKSLLAERADSRRLLELWESLRAFSEIPSGFKEELQSTANAIVHEFVTDEVLQAAGGIPCDDEGHIADAKDGQRDGRKKFLPPAGNPSQLPLPTIHTPRSPKGRRMSLTHFTQDFSNRLLPMHIFPVSMVASVLAELNLERPHCRMFADAERRCWHELCKRCALQPLLVPPVRRAFLARGIACYVASVLRSGVRTVSERIERGMLRSVLMRQRLACSVVSSSIFNAIDRAKVTVGRMEREAALRAAEELRARYLEARARGVAIYVDALLCRSVASVAQRVVQAPWNVMLVRPGAWLARVWATAVVRDVMQFTLPDLKVTPPPLPPWPPTVPSFSSVALANHDEDLDIKPKSNTDVMPASEGPRALSPLHFAEPESLTPRTPRAWHRGKFLRIDDIPVHDINSDGYCGHRMSGWHLNTPFLLPVALEPLLGLGSVDLVKELERELQSLRYEAQVLARSHVVEMEESLLAQSSELLASFNHPLASAFQIIANFESGRKETRAEFDRIASIVSDLESERDVVVAKLAEYNEWVEFKASAEQRSLNASEKREGHDTEGVQPRQLYPNVDNGEQSSRPMSESEAEADAQEAKEGEAKRDDNEFIRDDKRPKQALDRRKQSRIRRRSGARGSGDPGHEVRVRRDRIAEKLRREAQEKEFGGGAPPEVRPELEVELWYCSERRKQIKRVLQAYDTAHAACSAQQHELGLNRRRAALADRQMKTMLQAFKKELSKELHPLIRMIKGLFAPLHSAERLLLTVVGCVAMKHGTMLRDVTARLSSFLEVIRASIVAKEAKKLAVRRMVEEYSSTVARLQRTVGAVLRDVRSRDKQISHERERQQLALEMAQQSAKDELALAELEVEDKRALAESTRILEEEQKAAEEAAAKIEADRAEAERLASVEAARVREAKDREIAERVFADLEPAARDLHATVQEAKTFIEKQFGGRTFGFEAQNVGFALDRAKKLVGALEDKRWADAVRQASGVAKRLGLAIDALGVQMDPLMEANDAPDFPAMLKEAKDLETALSHVNDSLARLDQLESERAAEQRAQEESERAAKLAEIMKNMPVGRTKRIVNGASSITRRLLGREAAEKLAVSKFGKALSAFSARAAEAERRAAVKMAKRLDENKGSIDKIRARYLKTAQGGGDFITDPFGWKRDVRTKAAIKMQALFRGRMERKRVAERAARQIQSVFRRRKAKERVLEEMLRSTKKLYDNASAQYYYVNLKTGAYSWGKPYMLEAQGIDVPFGERRRPKDFVWTELEAARLVQGAYRTRQARYMYRAAVYATFEKIYEPSQERYFYQNTNTKRCQWHKPFGLASWEDVPPKNGPLLEWIQQREQFS